MFQYTLSHPKKLIKKNKIIKNKSILIPISLSPTFKELKIYQNGQ